MEQDHRQRFSGKADLYAAGRPSYAEGFLRDLKERFGFSEHTAVADIGSGTGMLTRQLLGLGCRVYAVEPNADMRRIAERDLSCHPGFCSLDGDAAQTKLPAASVDAVTAAQAFHWFPVEAFRQECLRIGKPGCRIFLIWNQRDMSHPVTQALYRLYQTHGKDFRGFNRGLRKDDERIRAFFRDDYRELEYPNPLTYDRDHFQTRCLSSSHSPQPGEANYEAYMAEVNRIFDTFAAEGRLTVANVTTVYTGTLVPDIEG